MSYRHVKRIDLFNNGVGYEVIVVKEDKSNGDVYFIRTDQLDEVDFSRVRGILSRRDAQNYEMWDLMSNITLKNGENALKYFHQYVKVRTRSGEIMAPNQFRAGMPIRTLDPRNQALVGKPVEEEELFEEVLEEKETVKRTGGRKKAE